MKLDCHISHVVANAGDMNQIGMGLASAGWQTLFHGKARWNNQPTVRECADWCVANGGKGLFLHNPGGLFPKTPERAEMWFEQAPAAVERLLGSMLPSDPDWPLARKRVDWCEFVEAARTFPHDIVAYVGAPYAFARIGSESQASWLKRALAALLPFRLVCDAIALDNTLGTRPTIPDFFNGKFGVVADLVKELLREQLGVWHEPTNYVSDKWLATLPKQMDEQFIRNMHDKGWPLRTVDHEPLQVPGSLGEPWYILARTDWRYTTQQLVDHLNKLQQDFPTAQLLVYTGHIKADLIEGGA